MFDYQRVRVWNAAACGSNRNGTFQPAHGAAVLALCRHDAAAAPNKADHATWFLLPLFCSSLVHQKTKNVFQTKLELFGHEELVNLNELSIIICIDLKSSTICLFNIAMENPL